MLALRILVRRIVGLVHLNLRRSATCSSDHSLASIRGHGCDQEISFRRRAPEAGVEVCAEQCQKGGTGPDPSGTHFLWSVRER